MLDLFKSLGQVTAHTLRGRERVGILRVTFLQLLQLTHHPVELLVADGGLVEHIVVMVVLVELPAQLLNAMFEHVHRSISEILGLNYNFFLTCQTFLFGYLLMGQ